MGRFLRGRVTLTVVGVAELACVLFGVGCQSGPFLQTEQFVTRDGQEERVGRACMSLQKGSGMGGGRAPGVPGAAGEGTGEAGSEHSFSYEGTGNAVRLTVVDGAGKTLVDRSYDSAFIDAGRKHQVTIETDGETLRFVAWGVPTCEQ
jgi:hypothetical protein